MDLLLNGFKQALAEHAPQYGTWNSFASNYATEVIAQCAYDWMLIDGEHAPNTVPMILSQLQAAAPYKTHPVVRTVNHDPALIKQLLDIGATTLMVPMVESAEQARNLVRAMRYPPHGFRGIGGGLTRATRWDGIPDYLTRADGSVCLVVQIESQGGFDNVEAIAQVEGVHGLFVGPADLSAALGHPGDASHSDVQHAIKRIIDVARAAGKGAGILAPAYEDAVRYREWGASFIAVAIDIPQLRHGLTQTLSRYKTTGTTETNADSTSGKSGKTY
jgi:2-keto-3-deoxy-L-rhamnonate aldolase RhmA